MFIPAEPSLQPQCMNVLSASSLCLLGSCSQLHSHLISFWEPGLDSQTRFYVLRCSHYPAIVINHSHICESPSLGLVCKQLWGEEYWKRLRWECMVLPLLACRENRSKAQGWGGQVRGMQFGMQTETLSLQRFFLSREPLSTSPALLFS